MLFIYPPEGSRFYTKYDTDIFGEFLTDLKNFTSLGSTACDMNSRIGLVEDYMQHDKLDDHVLEIKESCFIYPIEPLIQRRSSKESHVNSVGRRFISICQQSGLRVLSGWCKSDTHGNITFQNRLGTSVIDYAAIHFSLMNWVHDFQVEDRFYRVLRSCSDRYVTLYE